MMFIDSNNFAAGHIGILIVAKKIKIIRRYTYYIYKINGKKPYGDSFSSVILQRTPIITYGVPFALCRTTNHHHTGENSFNNFIATPSPLYFKQLPGFIEHRICCTCEYNKKNGLYNK